jgi:Piwi domain
MPTHLSEIFPLDYSQLNTACFRFSPEIDRETGNRFSWYFSKHYPEIVVVYEQKYFWILAKPNQTIPSYDEWKEVLEIIQDKLKEDLGDRYYFIQWVKDFAIDASIVAQLAVRLLKINRPFSAITVSSEKQIEIKRECEFWAETIELDTEIKAAIATPVYPDRFGIYPDRFGTRSAIALTLTSKFLYSGDLEKFFTNHPDRNDPAKLLIGLQVKDIERNSTATIVNIAGTIEEHKDRLLKQATGSLSKEKLQLAPPEQPVVTIQFGKDSQKYDYAMAALKLFITSKNVRYFEIEYGELLKQAKILYQERKKLLALYKQEAKNILAIYNLQLANNCINSQDNPNLFWTPSEKLEETQLLFGKGVTSKKNAILRGLSSGSVYRRHCEFNDPFRPIRFAVLKICEEKAGKFRQDLQQCLKKYGFDSSLADEHKKSLSLEGLSDAEKRATVENAIDEILQIPCDLVLVFLPQSDRDRDDSDGDSLYAWVSSRLLRRKISSQIIYESTLKNPDNYRHILNNVVPGILAKLGNLPFVLAESLKIADYFIGLDVARKPKKNLPGSMNFCACVRLYGQKGEFIRYQLADSLTEGEEIPARILRDFLPQANLRNKKVLIYRDGSFRGDEIKHLLDWGQAINAQFILVECSKSRNPRLYNLEEKLLTEPTRGLALRISSQEAIVVTTQVPERVGVSQPLRLKVKKEGLLVPIEDVVNLTLKLTLLHHGSLKDPRLPIPLFGSDRIAYRRLQGIYPGELEGDKQYWL